MIIIVSGPGGVGKGTVVSRLVDTDPRLWLSRSWTTRARRHGEPEDAYHFVDRDHFERHVDDGGFLEWVEFLDYLQGTPRPDPPPDSDVVLEIDVHGARQVREAYPDALLVWMDAPSREEQRARLEARGDTPERIAARLALADAEARVAEELGATTVVNDDLDAAVARLAELIDEARRSR